MEEDVPGPSHRRIRSYVTRAGRISKAQERALTTLWPLFGVDYVDHVQDPSLLFGRQGPVVLEIGFGMGETTAQIAHALPEVNFLGIEVHTPGVGALLKLIEDLDLKNVRIIRHDAVEVLMNMIAEQALDGVHIYFPDPWHKSRHQKRRLIQPPFIELLVSRLKPGGYLHCATDWENYAEQMLLVLGENTELENTGKKFATRTNPRVDRPLTKFEQRGRRLGHGVWDLVFLRKIASISDP